MAFSLRYRLVGPLLVLLLADVLATWGAAIVAARNAEDRIQRELHSVARTLTDSPTFPLTPRVLEQMKGLSGAEFLLIQEHRANLTTFDPPVSPESIQVDELTHQQIRYRILEIAFPEHHPNAGAKLLICYSEAARSQAVRDAIRPPLLLGVGLGLATIVVLMLGQRVIGRVRELEQRTRLIAQGDFQPMQLPATQDELRQLAASINDMTRQLQEFQERQQREERLRLLGQLGGGLAHQLRNAASGSKLALQLAAQEMPITDREPIDVALRQLQRMEQMLGQFLSIGRPGLQQNLPCDLAEITRISLELLQPQARHTGARIDVKIPDHCPLRGDSIALGHLVGNLIGNAIDAAGPSGSIEVKIETEPDWHQLTVSDSGPGPAPEVADKLFEPFVTGKEQGVGLGLAVAKQSVDAHGGTLHWERREGKTLFIARLPATNPVSPR